MKKETKALIKWMKAQIKIAAKLDDSYLITPVAIDTHKSFEEDAEKFLDSLPKIESHLCRGGYIQDRNGTPCCNEDNVRFVVTDATDEEWCLGRLIWKPKLSAFQIISNAFTCFVSNVKWFEKVENYEAQPCKDIK